MKRGAPLKRSALKPGAKSLERGSTFASRGSLKRSGMPRTAALASPPARRRELPGERGWTQRVFELHGDRCVVCGRKAVHAHHVTGKDVILRATHLSVPEREALAFDERQGCPVCFQCHMDHEAAAHRIPFDRLPAGAVEWALEHGFRSRVMDRRVYPREAS